MPATVEALFIVLVFIMPGFVTLQTKSIFVPSGAKPSPVQVTLHSITVSLFYLPLWLLSLPALLRIRSEVMAAAQGTLSPPAVRTVTWDVCALALVHSLLLPAAVGGVWAIAVWNDLPTRLTARFYRRLNIPAPSPGVGDNLWDRLWVNRRQMPWLTVYMKDGRIYVGRGVEFALASEIREILLGADTSMYDGEWNPIRELPRGEGVWIPVGEVSSIDIHE